MKKKSLLFATVRKYNTIKNKEKPEKTPFKTKKISVKKYGSQSIVPLNYYKNISQIIDL